MTAAVADSNGAPAGAGVCIVRIELQPGGQLITVTTNRSVGRTLFSAAPDTVRHYTSRESAMQSIAAFLQSFEPRRHH